MKTVAIIAALFSVFAGSSVVYADQAGLSVRHLATTNASEFPDHFVTKPVTSIMPGSVVYQDNGTRVGAVRAVIHDNTVINKIYIGTSEYSAGDITIENGRAIYRA
jgi:hypothetical protein